MLSLMVVDALLMTWLLAAVHSAPLSTVNLGRDAWLEDFENIARQVHSRLSGCRGTARRSVLVENLNSIGCDR